MLGVVRRASRLFLLARKANRPPQPAAPPPTEQDREIEILRSEIRAQQEAAAARDREFFRLADEKEKVEAKENGNVEAKEKEKEEEKG